MTSTPRIAKISMFAFPVFDFMILPFTGAAFCPIEANCPG
jgi:hypothetical protein